MVDVQTEIIIKRPVEAVAAYAQDPGTATKWYKNISSSKLLTPKPMQVGSQIAFEAAFLGKKLVYTYEVMAYEPNKQLVMQTSSGPFAMQTTYEWEALGQSTTKMRLRNRGEPQGFSRLAAPFMSMAMRRANQKDLANIKRLLEA